MVRRFGEGPDNGLVLLGGYVRSDRHTSQFSRFAFLGAIAPSPLPNRPHDNVGAVVSWARISPGFSQTQILQAQAGLPLSDDALGVQGDETILEGRYEVALRPGLSLMPDVQYVVQPGAARTYPNATVLAVQVKASF